MKSPKLVKYKQQNNYKFVKIIQHAVCKALGHVWETWAAQGKDHSVKLIINIIIYVHVLLYVYVQIFTKNRNSAKIRLKFSLETLRILFRLVSPFIDFWNFAFFFCYWLWLS